MRNNAILRIILFSLAILVLASLLLGGFVFGNLVTSLGKDYSYKENELVKLGDVELVASFDPQDIRNIEIDWAAGAIRVIASADTRKITISETEVKNSNYKMSYTSYGNTLKIEFDKQKLYFGISYDHAKDLVIEVPADWVCSQLEIDTASAYVSLCDMSVGKIDFDGASGTLQVTNCNVDELDVDTASGDVNFQGQLNLLDCDAASANCKISVTNQPHSIEIDSASGNLDLTLPEDCSFLCEMETLSGNFSSDFETTKVGSTYLHGDGHCRINVSALSGDVTIRKDIPCSDPNCTEASHNHKWNHH